MKTQAQLILEHMQNGGRITKKGAERWPFLCRNLPGRIFDLRRSGYRVTTRTLKSRCPRTGKRIAYAQYYLEDV